MEETQKEAIENYIESYNSFDVDGMLQDLSQNVIFENVSAGNVDMRLEGIKSFKEQAETAKGYFKERKQVINSWNFEENKVVINISYKGILNIELPNGMKPGDTLELIGKSTFTFDDSKIVKIVDES